jgi:predicted NAD/FAD-binding protein
MRIAIIGSGVSGLTSAYLLSPSHEITIFEKSDRIGGHAHTIIVKEDGKKIAVDNGFMVYNPERYPNFVQLLNQLGVESIETTMSFGLEIPGEISYNSDLPNGIFAVRANIFNLRFLKFLYNITRFRKKARQALVNSPESTETLGQFLKNNNFNQDVANWFLFPTLSAIWSIKEIDKVNDFPAMSTFRFLDNHKLLNTTQPRWKTIKGGSIEYVSRVRKSIEDNGGGIMTKANVTSIKRSGDAIDIVVNGKEENFDYVIFATHADTTKKLISDISKEEKNALDKFSYTNNKTVLHKDRGLVPSNHRLLAAWNYTQKNDPTNGTSQTSFTYCMNILQHIPHDTPVFVTLNPKIDIDKNMIYAIEEYSHPQYNLESLDGQKAISKLQGKRNTFYTGAYLGYGFHEDGVVSAIQVAKKLNISPPWQNQK